MICSRCGHELPSNDTRFCPQCGTQVAAFPPTGTNDKVSEIASRESLKAAEEVFRIAFPQPNGANS